MFYFNITPWTLAISCLCFCSFMTITRHKVIKKKKLRRYRLRVGIYAVFCNSDVMLKHWSLASGPWVWLHFTVEKIIKPSINLVHQNPNSNVFWAQSNTSYVVRCQSSMLADEMCGMFPSILINCKSYLIILSQII